MSAPYDRLESWVLAWVGGALCLLAAVVTAEGSPAEHPWLPALARASAVGVLFAVGLHARRRPPVERFGVLLILAGVGMFLATLAEADESLRYSIGRLSGWVVEAWFVYLVLAYPAGRLRGRADRTLVAAAALLPAVLYLPTALLVEQYPLPSPWTSCQSGCPDNAFMVTGSEPALIGDVVVPLREFLTAVLLLAVAARVLQRLRAASRLARRAQAPPLAVACGTLVASAVAVVARPEALLWLTALAIPLLAVAFAAGLARWRLFVTSAMQRLAGQVRPHSRPEDVRRALAEAFDDPTLTIVYGSPLHTPRTGAGRGLTEVRDAGGPVAAIVHDAALCDEPAFVDSAGSYTRMTLENHQLAAGASRLVRAVSESRARVQRSADGERHRIERDLHDGAQQRLVALRIKLELTAERLGPDPAAELLRRLAADVDAALDEIRRLAHGIYPSPLAHLGLVDALQSAALQGSLPVTVRATGVRRGHPREVESAVYFCCLEALENAGTHARGATAAVIEVADTGERIRFEVRDDGSGFDPAAARGTGLTGMRDRVAAAGGDLAIVSSPGRGTRVIGSIPLADRSAGRRRPAALPRS